MDLIKLAYGGTKPFNDKRCGSFRAWQPGDEHLVSHMAAKKLLKYAEFSLAKGKAPKAAADGEQAKQEPQAADKAAQTQEDAERAAALAQIETQKKAQEQEHNSKEDMLLAIGTWDKDALKDYAAKYEVNINKTRGLQTIREEVAGLVEMYGVR